MNISLSSGDLYAALSAVDFVNSIKSAIKLDKTRLHTMKSTKKKLKSGKTDFTYEEIEFLSESLEGLAVASKTQNLTNGQLRAAEALLELSNRVKTYL